MGKCLSCFHVRTTEPLPSISDSSFVDAHINKQEAGQSSESVSHQDSSFAVDNTNHIDKAVSSMSNGTSKTPYTSSSRSNSSSIASMQRPLRSSIHSRSRQTNDIGNGPTLSTVSENKINTLFEKYRDRDCTDEECILADGIEQMCNDLNLSPDDVRILVLAWKLDAQQMCKFTKQEFVNGLKVMNVDSIKDIQNKLPELVNKCRDNAEEFKSLYRFTFRFGLDSSCGQRILPIDMAIILWKLVFSIRVVCDESYILTAWLNFLSQHTHVVRGIPRDTWNMFLTFYDTIGDDLSKYDDTEAWPSLLDDFVEYQTDKSNQNTSEITNRNKASNGTMNQTV
ncbi:hypothetical protein WDU94_007263 [Cyamophila willieti]